MTDALSRLKKTGERVEAILTAFPETRGDDRELVSNSELRMMSRK